MPEKSFIPADGHVWPNKSSYALLFSYFLHVGTPRVTGARIIVPVPLNERNGNWVAF